MDWSATGLVSVFGRERLAGEPWLGGPPERSRVLVHDPGVPRRVRPRLAEQIRAQRAGWVERRRAARPRDARAERAGFAAAYTETMRRAGAAERYFFDRSYLDAALSYERSWLVVARRDGELGAAAIAAVSDSILHYFLGGTADAARGRRPSRTWWRRCSTSPTSSACRSTWAAGWPRATGWRRFKRGFANGELPFCTQQVVCDPDE